MHVHDPAADASTLAQQLDRVNALVKERVIHLDSLPTTATAELIDEALHSVPYMLSDDGIGLHGPRWFGLVTGGVNPAAHVADELVTSFDANVCLHTHETTIASMLEVLTLNWLLDMLDLSRHDFTHNTFTTGATGSNVLGIALGRDAVVANIHRARGHDQWSVPDDGLGGVDVQVFVAGAHASIAKACAIVGIGRKHVVDVTDKTSVLPCDFDLSALEAHLSENDQDGRGSIVVLSVGEVNTGGWTSNAREIAALCKQYKAWFHIDAAFGAFALLAKKFQRYASDLALGDSITGDAHKYISGLNVPYDCGIFFSRSSGLFDLCGPGANAPAYLKSAPFTGATAYTHIDEYRTLPSPLTLNIENSRRFRALPVFASLLSLGKHGYASLVERNLLFTETVTTFMLEHPGYDILTPDETSGFVQMNIVLFGPSDRAPAKFQGEQGVSYRSSELVPFASPRMSFGRFGNAFRTQHSQLTTPNCILSISLNGKTLGQGTYAVVREVVSIETGKYYACKVISKRLMKGHEKMIINEIKVMEGISKGHPNILTLVDYFETVNSLYIVTDLCKGGELFARICEKRYFRENDAAKLVQTICSAVEYLHKKGVVHRDLKPENLLFESQDEDSKLMVADFGLSKIVDENTYSTLSTTCGTPAYMAPEIFSKKGYGKAVDMWAVGVITYFLLCGYTPFDRESQAAEIEAVCKADYAFEPAEYWKHVSETAKDFINKLLTVDTSKRLTASGALSHPFLSSSSDSSTTTHDLLPTFKQHADAKEKLSRGLTAVLAMGALKEEGLARKTRREEMGEEDRKVVEAAEQARKESEDEAAKLEFVEERHMDVDDDGQDRREGRSTPDGKRTTL
ncbi:Calcium/calmodulin-dependent protein kinase type I [Microbotryomycetes sp. JL201]|nr:Calcium/calmodulin-dependent protein kinase type I [Microbotryomycetes sp. JL201]